MLIDLENVDISSFSSLYDVVMELMQETSAAVKEFTGQVSLVLELCGVLILFK